MTSLNISIKTQVKQNNKKIVVELDANKFEKIAGDFGLFNPEFLDSVNRAEKDYKAGRVQKIKSLRSLSE